MRTAMMRVWNPKSLIAPVLFIQQELRAYQETDHEPFEKK